MERGVDFIALRLPAAVGVASGEEGAVVVVVSMEGRGGGG